MTSPRLTIGRLMIAVAAVGMASAWIKLSPETLLAAVVVGMLGILAMVPIWCLAITGRLTRRQARRVGLAALVTVPPCLGLACLPWLAPLAMCLLWLVAWLGLGCFIVLYAPYPPSMY